MNHVSILDLAGYINEQIVIGGVPYKFYNNGTHMGSYKKYPIADRDRSVDGHWEIAQNENGYELITTPALGTQRLYLSIALIPESVLNSVTQLTQS